MKQTATLTSLSGSLGTSVKIILTFLFLNFLTQSISAQSVKIDGLANSAPQLGNEWCQAGLTHIQDLYGNGVAEDQYATGSKDWQYAADWRWSISQTKGKNDLANVSAGVVPAGTVQLLDGSYAPGGPFLVFAGDRVKNEGDAQIGFWFFQNGTAPVDLNNVKNFQPAKYVGTPGVTIGDLLILADFTGGGRLGTVTVLEWTGTGGNYSESSAFNLLTVQAGVAENNTGTTPVPGCFGYPTTSYETNAFFEGYVDLGLLTGNGNGACFGRVQLEGRASQEITAALDDFVGGPLGSVPNCSIAGTNSICAGGSTTFTASGGANGIFTYRWSGPGVAPGTTGAVLSNLTAAGTYNVTVANATGCTTACGRTLTINPPPTCDISGNNTICSYQSASFTATGGGTYLWSTGATSATISNLTAAGVYSVTVTSGAGCKSSCSRTLTVNPPPSCNITGNNTICSGGSTSFTATGGGTYLWSTGATGAVLSNLTAAGTYSVTVTSGAGCTSSCNRVLTVNQTPSCDISGNNTICSYQSASFTATGGGTYLWSTGATGAVLSNLTAAGTYSVTVTSAVGGCTSSCSRVLTVNPPPSCNITGNNTICTGNSASFTATGGGTYLWSTGSTSNVISNLTAAGTYSVTVTSGAGCTSSCSRVLTVITNPVCDISGNNTICSYQSASFTASGGSSYLWSTGATSATINNLTAAGTYSVTVTAGGGCTSSCSRTLTVNQPPSCNITGNNTICSYQSASFTATGGGTYLWSTGATSATISNLTAAGTYSVTVTSGAGCTSSCSRVLTVNPPPSCEITGNNTICVGNSASFTASGGSSYLWSTGATGATISNLTAAGTYNVTVTSAAGCTSSCSRTLTVNQTPTVSAGTDPLAQCRAATVTNGSLVYGTNTFSVTGSNLTNAVLASPAWSVVNAGGYTVNIVSPNSLTTNVQVSGDVNGGSVTLRITANSNASPSCGTATDNVVLTLNPRPLVRVLVGSDFCPNVTATGSVALFNSENGVSYQLKDDGNNDVQGPKTGNGGTLLWTGLGDGDYTVVGTFLATSCNTTSGPASVVENPVPEVILTPFAQQCNSEGTLPVSLIALANLLGGEWSGTGVVNGIFYPAGLAPGQYTLTYTFTNIFNCRSSATIQATVVSCVAQICTYTQGYFGNPGGLSCDGENGGLTTIGLINQSLGNWPGASLKIGVSQLLPTNIQNYVQIDDLTGGACVIEVLPGGGPAKEISGANNICSLPPAMLQNGRIKNVLLAQTIALGLNIGITSPSTLGDFALKAGTLYTADPVGGCGSDVPKLRRCNYDPETHLLTSVDNEYESRTFSQALIDAIEDAGYPKTVLGLFGLANDALGNKDGVVGSEQGLSLSEIAGAAGSINEVFDECRISVGWDIGPCPPSDVPAPARITVSASAEAATIGKLKVSTYPNPYRSSVRFVIESPVAGQAILDVYNLAGQKVQTLFNGHIDANETRIVDYKPTVANGMLIYTLRIGNRQVTGKLIGLKQ